MCASAEYRRITAMTYEGTAGQLHILRRTFSGGQQFTLTVVERSTTKLLQFEVIQRREDARRLLGVIAWRNSEKVCEFEDFIDAIVPFFGRLGMDEDQSAACAEEVLSLMVPELGY